MFGWTDGTLELGLSWKGVLRDGAPALPPPLQCPLHCGFSAPGLSALCPPCLVCFAVSAPWILAAPQQPPASVHSAGQPPSSSLTSALAHFGGLHTLLPEQESFAVAPSPQLCPLPSRRQGSTGAV